MPTGFLSPRQSWTIVHRLFSELPIDLRTESVFRVDQMQTLIKAIHNEGSVVRYSDFGSDDNGIRTYFDDVIG
jgi:hypothetical protein